MQLWHRVTRNLTTEDFFLLERALQHKHAYCLTSTEGSWECDVDSQLLTGADVNLELALASGMIDQKSNIIGG